MAASTFRSQSVTLLRGATSAWERTSEVASLAEKIHERQEAALARRKEQHALEEAARGADRREELTKSFSFHIGADLKVPTSNRRRSSNVMQTRAEAEQSASHGNPFAGIPLQAWAERLGERVMPAYEIIKEEQRKGKLAAKQSVASAQFAPSIPHVLPFTCWAANSQSIRDTLVAEDPKTRKRARMSWYHPDDTMVPRDWFKGGLLADLKYYSPFRSSSATSSGTSK